MSSEKGEKQVVFIVFHTDHVLVSRRGIEEDLIDDDFFSRLMRMGQPISLEMLTATSITTSIKTNWLAQRARVVRDIIKTTPVGFPKRMRHSVMPIRDQPRSLRHQLRRGRKKSK